MKCSQHERLGPFKEKLAGQPSYFNPNGKWFSMWPIVNLGTLKKKRQKYFWPTLVKKINLFCREPNTNRGQEEVPLKCLVTKKCAILRSSLENKASLWTHSVMEHTEQQGLEQLEHSRVQEEQAGRSHWEHVVLEPWFLWHTQQEAGAAAAPTREKPHGGESLGGKKKKV